MANFKCLFLLLLATTLQSCDKEDLVAPPITQENSFSCKINGKLFVPEFHGGFPSPGGEGIMVVTLIKNKRWVIILGNGEIDIYLHITELDKPGEYEILKSDSDITFVDEDDIAMKLTSRKNNNIIFYSSQDNTGTINVLEWNNENILVAEFKELRLYNSSDPTETIILTDGKLNINLETLNQD